MEIFLPGINIKRHILCVRNFEFSEDQVLANEPHKKARRIAAEETVLWKNEQQVLPLSSKYRKITMVGEYAVSPLISG